MQKIVITGGLGYIGMELSKIYSGKSRTNEIIVLDKEFYSSRVSQLSRWGIKYEQCDILDIENLKKHVADADIIFHLAGITNVPTTIEQEKLSKNSMIRKTGVVGTRNIINYSKDNVKIIFPSTHVIFEGIQSVKRNITEKQKPKPILEYSKGKYQSELDLINSEKDFVILRLGSLYGRSFDSTRLNIMPNLFAKMSATGKTLKLFSKGKQLKSLVSVVDVARAMEFVEVNKNCSREIYNLVNENLTVADVAKICKKHNKKTKIVNTNDPIPNNGYTMSNEKIKHTGFEFLYSLDKSIKEMINDWSINTLDDSNENIEKGSNNFIDKRGIISNYYIDDSINMIGYVESKKETVRGNHFHPIQTQKCLLIKGKYLSVTKDLSKPNQPQETRIVNEGELSSIPPNVAHTMVFLEDSIFLNLVNGEREHQNYGITHTMPHILVDEKLGKFLVENYKQECRACESSNLEFYLSLGLSPLANNLKTKASDTEQLYPLELNLCKDCFNTQLSVVVPPDEMFDDYLYLSSTTEKFRNHFISLANKLQKEFKLNKKSLVVDIGSNDGIFLKPLDDLGINSIGVEPAKNVAAIANKNKLETFNSYFNKSVVHKINNKYGKADIVSAFNVFAHGDDLKQIALDSETLLKKNGVFIFEVQYFLDTLKDLTFDNIYHEHVNFWTVTSLLSFFSNLNLKLYKVEKVDTHGGSIRVYCSKNKKIKTHASVNKFLNEEVKFGVSKISTYLKFSEKISTRRDKSIAMLSKLKKENKKIIGFAAPAKATTALNFYGIDSNFIDYIIEDNSLKHNKFVPGVDIKIISKDMVNPEEVDYVLVLAWNFYEVIKDRNERYFSKSRFIKLS